jgi:Ca2+-binding RTX toxin-like protein
MAYYQYDAFWNTYRLSPDTQDLSLAEVHGQDPANAQGNLRDNVITGNIANNGLDGGEGVDTLIGSLGNDQYFVDNLGDVVIEEPEDGSIDEIIAYISYTLPDHVETLGLLGLALIDGTGNNQANALIGSSVNNRLYGGGGDDKLFGRDGDDTLDGGAGADLLWGDAGDDTFIIDESDEITEDPDRGIDWVIASFSYTLGLNLEHLRLDGTLPLTGSGNSLDNHLIGAGGNDTLEGRDGQDTLDGGVGADRLEGGAGDDVYRVDDAGDQVVEIEGGGYDHVETLVSYSLAALVEDLFAAGDSTLSLTGNAFANSIRGNAAANTLDGGAGADTLSGGNGDDTYVCDGLDTIIELADGGIDTIWSALSYTLGEYLEHLIVTGTMAVALTGNSLANILAGNAAANTLDGAAGADHLMGGAGDDTYIVDGADRITELAGEGFDTVLTGFSLTLGENLENLTATGVAAVSLTGNGLANILTGNAAANRLDGGAGTDTLSGGAGDDTYIIDGADWITEHAGGGTDTVVTGSSYTLGEEFENLTASGTAALSLTGSALDNIISGNASANLLDGGTGADSLNGGAGDDTFLVDNAADLVTEIADGGRDTVLASLSYALAAGAEVEVLKLSGVSSRASASLTGSDTANEITGHAGTNTLKGQGGSDRLSGGLGNDKLYGGTGTGKDVFVFDTRLSKTKNVDKIYDFNTKNDSLQLENKIFTKLGKGSAAGVKFKSDMFTTGTKAKDREDRIVYDKKTGALYYDQDGTGSKAQVKIATLTNKATLKYDDFFVI